MYYMADIFLGEGGGAGEGAVLIFVDSQGKPLELFNFRD